MGGRLAFATSSGEVSKDETSIGGRVMERNSMMLGVSEPLPALRQHVAVDRASRLAAVGKASTHPGAPASHMMSLGNTIRHLPCFVCVQSVRS